MGKLIFLLTFLIVQAAFAVPCPKGPKEETLSVQRIMRNFGRHFAPAEAFALKYSQDPKSISDTEIKSVIEGLMIVKACADEALKLKDKKGYNEDLLPNRSYFMDEAGRADYLEAYSHLMTTFSEQIVELQKLFESGNFSDLSEKIKAINKFIDGSHRGMSCRQSLGGIK